MCRNPECGMETVCNETYPNRDEKRTPLSRGKPCERIPKSRRMDLHHHPRHAPANLFTRDPATV